MSKTAIVTGAASGIGFAICEKLTESDFEVLALDLVKPTETIPGVDFRVFDVSHEESWVRLSQEILPPKAVVNAAGIAMRQSILEIDSDSWKKAFEVNVMGPMFSLRYLAPKMSGGSVTNIGSVAGLTGHAAVAYTSSKWALRGLTHSAANTLGTKGLRINIVHPGYIDTPLMDPVSPTFKDAHLANTPLGRIGSPAEIAAAVAFLISDEASYINGSEITIDGGFSSAGGTKLIADRAG